MRIVFLDFDGVLNSHPYFQRRQAIREILDSADHDDLDPEAVARLNRIIQSTGANVVVSSSWRHGRTLSVLRGLLTGRGFDGEVIGKTPDYVDGNDGCRGIEIARWIEHAPLYGIDVESFVILDDDRDMAHLQDRLVHTSMQVGLTEAHVEKAIEMLTKPPPTLVIPTPDMLVKFGT